MKYLLDTHLLLWWLAANPALSKEARELIAEPENTIFVSAVSLWEIWLKQSLGKLDLPADFEARLGAEGFENLPLKLDHTRGISRLPWHHRDPFDRMLLAQASAERLQLLTADTGMDAYGECVRLVK